MRSVAPATTTLIALSAVFFILSGLGNTESQLVVQLAQINALVAQGEWWRIFTPVLLHASLMHILFNMWALWVLGPQVERGVGTWPFLGLYIAAAGVGGAFVYYLSDPATIAVGASGAIFGLFGVWLNWAVRRRNTMQGRALLRQIGFLLLVNAAIPLFLPGVSWEAHLGGLIAGFVIGEMWARVTGRNATVIRTLIAFGVAGMAVLAVTI
jgi:membrane associated rhomboid family serine protease